MKDKKHYKILLIFPRNPTDNYNDLSSNVAEYTNKPGGMLILSLATVAALTPDYVSVKIIDENIEEIDFDAPCDIIGIGGFSSQYFRAREIGNKFRERGVLVVCGGSSATLSPDRWRLFSDVLILGEAERIWPEFINDYYKKSEFRDAYIETDRIALSETPLPDYSSISSKNLAKYWGGMVQTSRGCPFDCEFCDTPAYAGRKMYYKPIPQILSEVENIYQLNKSQMIGLADDNFTAGRKHAKAILKALGKWNKNKRNKVTFWTQFSIEAAKDEEMLQLLAEANVTRIFIGIESVNELSLIEAGKMQNLRTDMAMAIENIIQHGILVSAGCIVGFDSDRKSIFEQQLTFFNSLGIPTVLVWPLQAPDQTRLKTRLVNENRYLDWQDYETLETLKTKTVIPKNMTADELIYGCQWLVRELYSRDNFGLRIRQFFDIYGDPSNKNMLKTSIEPLNLSGLKIIIRMITRLILRLEIKDLKMLWHLVKYLQSSAHPQKYDILIGSFLTYKNSKVILKRANDGYQQLVSL